MKILPVLLFSFLVVIWRCRLMLVYQVGRHGARSSQNIFTGILKDESENFKSNGTSLTHLGMKLVFERGIEIMKSYSSKLGNLKLEDMQIRTSSTTRTYISALSQLLGMFGTQGCKDVFLKEVSTRLTEQIVQLDSLSPQVQGCLLYYKPMLKIEQEDDFIFKAKTTNCSLFQFLMKSDVLYSGKVKKEFEKIDKSISNWSSHHYEQLSAYQHSSFWDYLLSVDAHHLEVNPNVMNSTSLNSTILTLWNEYKYNQEKAITSKTPLHTKFIVSELVKDIIHAFDLTIDQDSENNQIKPKFYFDSAHETNIFGLMSIFNIDYGKMIQFGASLYIELHEDDVSCK